MAPKANEVLKMIKALSKQSFFGTIKRLVFKLFKYLHEAQK
jgi:hypothetical protein